VQQQVSVSPQGALGGLVREQHDAIPVGENDHYCQRVEDLRHVLGYVLHLLGEV
jgi:hypothetical protein